MVIVELKIELSIFFLSIIVGVSLQSNLQGTMTVKSLSETGMAQNTVAEIQGESKCFMKCLFVGSSFLSLFSSFHLSKYIPHTKSIALKMGPPLNFQLHLYHLRYHSILLLLILLFLLEAKKIQFRTQ